MPGGYLLQYESKIQVTTSLRLKNPNKYHKRLTARVECGASIHAIFELTVRRIQMFFSLKPSQSQGGSSLKISARWSWGTNKHTESLTDRLALLLHDFYLYEEDVWKSNFEVLLENLIFMCLNNKSRRIYIMAKVFFTKKPLRFREFKRSSVYAPKMVLEGAELGQ